MVRKGLLPEEAHNIAFSFGWIGIATFFAISGYIMVRSTWDSFGKDGSASRFAIGIVRIVPLYYIATLLALAWLTARGESFTLQDLGLSLLFVPYHSEVEGALRPILGQGWTLNYEMFFYALFTLALVFGTSRRALVPLVAAFPIIMALGAMYRPRVAGAWDARS